VDWQKDDDYEVPATTEGKRVWYTGAVGTEAGIADVIAERAKDTHKTEEVTA
jgi:sirohydrochlorin cobaltochelatase